jgi:DNA-binding Lrp family transcriptional regulator
VSDSDSTGEVEDRSSSGDSDEGPGESGDDRSAPAIDAIRGGPHDRATVAAVDRATADRLAALEDAGAVDGYVPLVDYDALGLRTAILRIDAHHANGGAVADDLREGAGVAVYRTSGRFDVVAVCRFPTAAAFERAVSRLASDPRVRTHRAAVTRRAVVEDGPLAVVDDAELDGD